MVNMKQLSSEGKIAYLIKPILKVLQEAGGQLERSEIKARIADLDGRSQNLQRLKRDPRKTKYLANLILSLILRSKICFVGLLTYTDTSPVTLTEKGLYLDVALDVEKEIMEESKSIGNS